MRRLSEAERHNSQEPIFTTQHQRVARQIAESQNFHQNKSSRSIQPDTHQEEAEMNDSFSNSIWTIRVYGHVVRAHERLSDMSGIGQQCAQKISEYLCHRIF